MIKVNSNIDKKKKLTKLLILDLKKPLIPVSHDKFWQNFKHFGIREVANKLLYSYLTGRHLIKCCDLHI